MGKKTKKKILISVISLLLAGAVGFGIFYGVTHSKKDPIPVISFMEVGMTEYWGDSMESHGPVSSDNIQTVFLTDTQTVTEVLVKEGDTVKKGDPLMTFDTTLSGLDLERKRLEVEKLKLELLDAESELKRILGLRPMQLPPEDDGEENLGTELLLPYRISGKPGFDGSAAEKPLVCWIREDTEIDERVISEILQFSLDMRLEDAEDQLSSPSAENGIEEPSSRDHEVLGVVIADSLAFRVSPGADAEIHKEVPCHQAPVKIYEQRDVDGTMWAFAVLGMGDYAIEGWIPMEGNIAVIEPEPVPTDPPVPVDPEPAETEGPEDTEPQNEESQPEETEPEETEPEIPRITVDFHCDPADAVVTLRRNDGSVPEKIGRNIFLAQPGNYSYTVQMDGYKPMTDKKLPVREDSGKITVHVDLEPYQDLSKLNSCYVVFKITDGNMSLGSRNLWQGVKIYQSGYFKFFDAAAIPDYTMAAELEEDSDEPEYDIGSGMTGSQIAEMRREQEKKIEDLKLNVKMADAEYKIKKRELEDGNIYADFDGKVVSLLTEEDSRSLKKPMIKVSGGGGFEIEGSVNELDRENMKLGQKVTVNDWNSGETYEGEIVTIGEFPVRSWGYSGRGNPNCSYYPFTVFVDGEADLQTGSYVNIQYSSGESENGIYLENPFIREEKGQSYVYVLGGDQKLEKRTVTTGKALWGSYTEITSGLTEEDYLAFPYGKNVKPGARAEIGSMSDFYR